MNSIGSGKATESGKTRKTQATADSSRPDGMPAQEIRIDFQNGGIWVSDPKCCDDAYFSLDQLAAWASLVNEGTAGKTIQLDYVVPSFSDGGTPNTAPLPGND